MATQRDYYEVLEIPRDASEEEIRKAFRKKAMESHPDRNKAEDAAERFKQVNEAYQVLSDPQKRQQYDRFGHAGVAGAPGGYGRGFEGSDTFGGLGDIFDAFFGGFGTGTRTRAGSRTGADLRAGLNLDFMEAVFGTEKEVQVERTEVCERCRGIGAEPGTAPERCPTCRGAGEVRRAQQSVFGQFVHVATCPTCGGRGERIASLCRECAGVGRVRRRRRLKVTIPAGVEDGSQVRLTGEGDAGLNGGSPGNLYIMLRVRPHKVFERAGYDILVELPISVAQAALGDTITVPTLEGAAELRVPAGTQSGAAFRLKGKGVTHLDNSRRGDQLVTVRVVVPQNLTEHQRRLFQELAASLSSNGQDPAQGKGWFDRFKDAMGGEGRE